MGMPFQSKSFENYAPKGEFLQSGIDVSVVAVDDLIFGKIITRLLLWEVMKSRAYLINSNPKYLYDEVAGISLWLKQYEDDEFANKLEKINERIQKEFAVFRETSDKAVKSGTQKPEFSVDFLRYSDEILIEVFNLMSRLGWSPISKTKIATLLQDSSFKKDIEDAMGTIEKADIDEQDQVMREFVTHELVHGVPSTLSKEMENPSINAGSVLDGNG